MTEAEEEAGKGQAGTLGGKGSKPPPPCSDGGRPRRCRAQFSGLSPEKVPPGPLHRL